jgi:hypothetical protein
MFTEAEATAEIFTPAICKSRMWFLLFSNIALEQSS